MKSTKWGVIGISIIECGLYATPPQLSSMIYVGFNCRVFHNLETKRDINDWLKHSKNLADEFYEQELRAPISTSFDTGKGR